MLKARSIFWITTFLCTCLEAKPMIAEPIAAAVFEDCTYFPLENRIRSGSTFSYLSVDYKQDDFLALTSETFSGFVYGGQIDYERFSQSGLYALLQTNFLTGKLDEKHDIARLRVFESISKLCMGYSYTALQGERFRATPYLGLGFTFFSEKAQEDVFHEQTKYFTIFLPVGFLVQYAALDWVHLGFNLEWFPDLDTTVQSETEDKLRYVLSRSTGQFLVELPTEFHLTEHYSLQIVPFWKRIKTKKFVSEERPLIIPEKRRIYWGGQMHLCLLF